MEGSLVPITKRPNLIVVHSCTIIKNIYIVSNVEKLVRGNLISLFSASEGGVL